ncbi:unnamed protein product [Discosporangium mesarthrocarpum]
MHERQQAGDRTNGNGSHVASNWGMKLEGELEGYVDGKLEGKLEGLPEGTFLSVWVWTCQQGENSHCWFQMSIIGFVTFGLGLGFPPPNCPTLSHPACDGYESFCVHDSALHGSALHGAAFRLVHFFMCPSSCALLHVPVGPSAS